MLDCIPFGQPILVDHYSAPRHRSLLKRHDSKMRAGFAKLEAAADYARRADAVGTAGISVDDPDAVAKLAEKKSDLEIRRDWMKAANKVWKKAGTFEGSDIPPEIQAEGLSNMKVWHGVYLTPFPSYALTNLGARIRDAAKRSSRIERIQATAVDARIELEAATITADAEDNRIVIAFHNYLTKESYKVMRSAGFVWSPTRDGFTRKLSSYSVKSATELATTILNKEKS